MPPDDYPVPDMSQVRMIDVIRALADPVRLRIVQVLSDGEPHAKSETEWGFPIHKSTLTHHFKTLRHAGLTRTITTGRNHAIQLRRPELDARFPGLIEALTAPTPDP